MMTKTSDEPTEEMTQQIRKLCEARYNQDLSTMKEAGLSQDEQNCLFSYLEKFNLCVSDMMGELPMHLRRSFLFFLIGEIRDMQESWAIMDGKADA